MAWREMVLATPFLLAVATVPAMAADTRCYAELHNPQVCGNVVQGGGRQLACLRQHAAAASPLCRTMLVDRGLIDGQAGVGRSGRSQPP